MTAGTSDALADALRLLTLRDFSSARLAQRLGRRGHDAAAVRAAIARCRELGYLDDEAFGLDRARALLRRRPCGRRMLLHDLRRQGLPPTMSERVASRAYEQAGGEETVLHDALRRWLDRHGEPADWRALKRCADHLARRGFAAAAVRAALSSWFDDLSSP